MKILQLFAFFSLPHGGGTVDLVYKLSRALAQRGHEVTIYTSDFELDRAYIDSLQGIEVYPFRCVSSLAGFYLMPGMVGQVRKRLQDFDIIHLHCFRSFQNTVIHHYAKKYGIPYVLDTHGSLPRTTGGKRGVKWLLRWLFDIAFGYRILEDASKGMLFITNVDRLLKLTVRMLTRHMRVTNAAIYLYDKDTGSYKCMAVGRRKIEIQKEIKSTNVLIEWLKEKKAPLLIDDIINWVQKEAMFPHRIVLKRTLERLRVTMRSLKAALCVPAFIRGQTVGFLVLGNKLSGVGYTRDDIALLGTLSNSAAIAVENARMYEELHNRIKRIAGLYKEQHELFIDTATAFSYAVDLRDAYSRQHAQRIIEYCMIIIKGLVEELTAT